MGRKTVKGMFVTIVLFAFLFINATAWADPEITEVDVQPLDANNSNLTLYFEGVAPFTIYRSFDGKDWGVPLASGYTELSWSDSGLVNFTNYYYKVVDASAVATVEVAFPPNKDVHGNYARNSSACASCHVTHAAVGPKLLVSPTVVSLCTSCHDGTQSKYDVRNGRVNLGSTMGPSNAGPFGSLLTVTENPATDVAEGYATQSAQPVSEVVTSIHNLGTPVFNAPGTVSDRLAGLGCQDCHNPHGSPNYRNLNNSIFLRGDLVSSGVAVSAYAATDASQSRGFAEKVSYNSGSTYFCASCHSDFNQASGSGSAQVTGSAQGPEYGLSAAAIGKYMHSVNTPMVFDGEYFTTVLPLENGSGVNQVVCLTCHFAHGTNKSGISKRTSSSALIRLDNQGVCQDCHKR